MEGILNESNEIQQRMIKVGVAKEDIARLVELERELTLLTITYNGSMN